MNRLCYITILVLFIGCEKQPSPEDVIESSRKSVAEVEKQLESVRKSTDEAVKKFDDLTRQPLVPDTPHSTDPAEPASE